MQLPGLFPDYFAVGLRKTEGWLTFSGLWLSVISNAKPDLRDIRDPEKKRAAQGRTAQVTEGTLKAKKIGSQYRITKAAIDAFLAE